MLGAPLPWCKIFAARADTSQTTDDQAAKFIKNCCRVLLVHARRRRSIRMKASNPKVSTVLAGSGTAVVT